MEEIPENVVSLLLHEPGEEKHGLLTKNNDFYVGLRFFFQIQPSSFGAPLLWTLRSEKALVIREEMGSADGSCFSFGSD